MPPQEPPPPIATPPATDATDAVDRILERWSAGEQFGVGLGLVVAGLLLTRLAMKQCAPLVARPEPLPAPPALQALPAAWSPWTRAVAGFALRLGFGPPRSFTPVLLPLAFLVWFAATLFGAQWFGAGAAPAAAPDGLEAAPGPQRSLDAGGLRSAASVFMLVAALLLAFLWTWTRLFGAGLADLGLRRRGALRAVALALALYVAFLPVYLGAVALEGGVRLWFGEAPATQAAVAAFARHPELHLDWRVLAGIVVAAPLHEELLFRGVLLRYLERVAPGALALALNGALFSALHDSGHLAVFALGVALAWLMRRTGSLAAPLALHMVHNGVTLALIAGTATPG